MSKFTEGPWVVDEAWNDDIRAANEELVACAYPMAGGERDANARLIAAAPDMYQMLKRLHELGGLGLEVHDEIVKILHRVEGK